MLHPYGNSAAATLQVQLSMLAVALATTFPLLCSAAHLTHAPFADAVRAFAAAAEDFSAAVFPMRPGQQSAFQQCRQLHLLVYVRFLSRAQTVVTSSKSLAPHLRHCCCLHKHGRCRPGDAVLRLCADAPAVCSWSRACSCR